MRFQEKLLNWFAVNGRPLPWRRHYRPYEVWISEIMLQQTQMETVLPYYERWMKAFPTIASLAQADPEKVLKLWQGLGYYSRARNLHANAKRLVETYNGKFPQDYETILSLKGIGRYTAGAISSIAFNQDKPIVDGNVLRVLARLYAMTEPIDDLRYREKFWVLQEKLIPKGKARDFNQGLMELGALICTAQNPKCALCPLRAECAAYRSGDPEKFPIKIFKKNTVRVEAAAIILEKDGRFLIHRRPEGAIMGGLWEFPEWKLARERTLEMNAILKKTKKLAEKEFSASLSLKLLGTLKRNYTHHLESMRVFSAQTPAAERDIRSRENWPVAWVSKKDFEKYPFSSAHSKIAAQFIETSVSA